MDWSVILGSADHLIAASLSEQGNYDIHTVHASYQIPNIMNMKNFNVYLGAYVSLLEANAENKIANGDNDQRYGVRARFKYFF